MAKFFSKLGVAGKKCLLVTGTPDENLQKCVRNLSYVSMIPSSQLNAYVVLDCDKLLLTPDALQKMKEVFST